VSCVIWFTLVAAFLLPRRECPNSEASVLSSRNGFSPSPLVVTNGSCRLSGQDRKSFARCEPPGRGLAAGPVYVSLPNGKERPGRFVLGCEKPAARVGTPCQA
jgi:hypothetical protein